MEIYLIEINNEKFIVNQLPDKTTPILEVINISRPAKEGDIMDALTTLSKNHFVKIILTKIPNYPEQPKTQKIEELHPHQIREIRKKISSPIKKFNEIRPVFKNKNIKLSEIVKNKREVIEKMSGIGKMKMLRLDSFLIKNNLWYGMPVDKILIK